MLSTLTYGDSTDVLKMGLHQFLDEIQGTLNRIAEEVFQTYVLQPNSIDHLPNLDAPLKIKVPMPEDAPIQQQKMS